MTKTWNTENDDLQQELQEELDNIQEEEKNETPELEDSNDEVAFLKEALARNQADYQNFKKRVERDREDMVYFLKVDIFKKILPRVDDLERIIKNTPEDQKSTSLFEWVTILHKNLVKNLEDLWVIAFESINTEVDPDKHEVMTQVPSENPWIIIDEFEKWYMIWNRVLRIAKVVVWS